MRDFRDDLAPFLTAPLRRALADCPDPGAVREVRLRAGRPARLTGPDAELPVSPDAREIAAMASAMLGGAASARQEELRQGFCTLPGGHRAGFSGRAVVSEGRLRALQDVSCLCVRVARAVRGASEGIDWLDAGRPRSVLVISPPGCGKTTILRDAARALSEGGWNVAVADERSELAACARGVPALDVGPRTDVLDGCPKAEALRLLVRAMCPDVLVTDELGGAGDAEAVLEAARCGVAVIASAHGRDFADCAARPSLRALFSARAFGRVVALRGVGRVLAVWDGAGRPV